MANKLELTWYGKENELKVEPRIVIEDKKLSTCCVINRKIAEYCFKRLSGMARNTEMPFTKSAGLAFL